MSVILRDGRAAEAPRLHRYTEREIDRTRALHALRMRREGVPGHLIARYFGVSRSTVYAWLSAIPAEAAGLAAL